jgi:hypothetical protein
VHSRQFVSALHDWTDEMRAHGVSWWMREPVLENQLA